MNENAMNENENAQVVQYRQFLDLALRMRQAQKDYFKNRLWGDMTKAKQLERLVDAKIEALLAKKPEATQEQIL